MATLSQFFGQAQGSGTNTDIITDPRKLPLFTNRHTSLYYKFTTNNYRSDSEATFWNAVAHNNEVDRTWHAMSSDNTWETFVNYNGGAGRLYWIIGPSGQSVANAESWMRITVDGTAYTFKAQLFSQTEPATLAQNNFVTTTNSVHHNKPLWGSFGPLPNTGNMGNYYGPNSYYGYGEFDYDPATYWGNGPDKYGVRSVGGHRGILPIGELIMYGFPYVTFSNSLKIEFQVSTGMSAATTNYAHRGGAAWMKEPIVEI